MKPVPLFDPPFFPVGSLKISPLIDQRPPAVSAAAFGLSLSRQGMKSRWPPILRPATTMLLSGS